MAGAPRPVHAAAEHVPAGESGGPAGRRLRVSFLVPLPPSSSSCDAVQEEAMESIGGGSIGLCSGTGLGGGGALPPVLILGFWRSEMDSHPAKC